MELSEFIDREVVFVDDDFVTGQLLQRILRKRGLNIRIFRSGEEFITYFRSKKPDLVLLDVMMPGVSGIGVLKFIRERYAPVELPVVMLTADTNNDRIVEALKLGANDYIKKPMSPDVAVARIRTQLQFNQYYKDSLVKKELETLNSLIVTYNHEINNPLFIAIGNLPDDVSKLSNKRLQKVKSSLARIADITKAIRELTDKRKIVTIESDEPSKLYKLDSDTLEKDTD